MHKGNSRTHTLQGCADTKYLGYGYKIRFQLYFVKQKEGIVKAFFQYHSWFSYLAGLFGDMKILSHSLKKPQTYISFNTNTFYTQSPRPNKFLQKHEIWHICSSGFLISIYLSIILFDLLNVVQHKRLLIFANF